MKLCWMVLLTGTVLIGCEKKHDPLLKQLVVLQNAANQSSSSQLRSGIDGFSKFLETSGYLSKEKPLPEPAHKGLVSYIDCLEALAGTLEEREKQSGKVKKWSKHLEDVMNPLNKLKVKDYEAAVKSLQSKLEASEALVKKIDNDLTRESLLCSDSEKAIRNHTE
ncbi:MAG: hypothetical protein HRU19_14090 [Pseudobacteriovorax sp.]|nr:hypothetical protein [Pseudobacteriovorax sp.]